MDILQKIQKIIKIFRYLLDGLPVSPKMYSLESENTELKEKIRLLEEKIRLLEEEKKDRSTKEFKNQAYYFDGEGPFCSRCYDDDSKKIRMLEHDNHFGSIMYVCPKCQNEIYGREGVDIYSDFYDKINQ